MHCKEVCGCTHMAMQQDTLSQTACAPKRGSLGRWPPLLQMRVGIPNSSNRYVCKHMQQQAKVNPRGGRSRQRSYSRDQGAG